jgi:ABC-type uncharacterized transport system involved in gliding motility auxiliary subunit
MAASRCHVWSSLIGVIAVLAIVVGINMLADVRLSRAQADLTQQRLYSLSEGTKTVLRGLKEPITLRLFYSRRLGSVLPVYGAYDDRVSEMLRQYASLAGGKVKLEFYDPEPFSDTEDRALAYGLQGVPVDAQGGQVYFGIAGTNLEDDEKTIGFLQPERERFLEYDLTRLVYELSNPKRPVVGIMSSLPLDGDQRTFMQSQGRAGRPWMAVTLLRETDSVKQVPLDAQVIDPDIQVLIVAQAQNLTDTALYAIDQFVMRGGRLMAMVDPYSEMEANTQSPTGLPPEEVSSNLAKLFDAWGIGYDPKTVVGDLSGAWRVRGNPGDRTQAVDYVAWFNIRDGIAHDDPATGDLQQITVAAPGALTKKEGATIDFKPLLSSSKQSGTLQADQLRFPDPAKLLANFKAEGGPRVIAARVRGPLKSAFTGPPAEPEGKERPANFPEFKAATDGPANLVVIADTDVLADRFWVRVQDFFGQQQATPFSDNGAFIANLIDTLVGGEALIGLRSRSESIRPFDKVDQIQRVAETRFRQTEQTLQQHLDETEKKLKDLRVGTGQGGAQQVAAVITPDQRQAVDQARQEIVETRQKLRGVQFELRRDITSLETWVKVINIALVPALLVVVAVVIGIMRRNRRARVHA